MKSRCSMESIRRKQMMYLYIGFLFLWSLGIALMPVASAIKEETKLLIYFSGTAFWIGAVGTIYMVLRINRCRKEKDQFNEKVLNLKQLGIIHFFQNKEAIVADISMFASIVGFIIAMSCKSELFVLFILFAVFTFSFGMHCMLNGINYKYIKYKVRRDGES